MQQTKNSTNFVIQLSWSWVIELFRVCNLSYYFFVITLTRIMYHAYIGFESMRWYSIFSYVHENIICHYTKSCLFFQTEKIIFSRNFLRYKWHLSQFQKRAFFLDFLEKQYSLYCQGRLSLIQFKRNLSSMVFFWNDWISRIPCFRISQCPQCDMIKVRKRLTS